MAEVVSSDVDMVSKLKRRLHDAAHRQKQAVTVLKVLNRLSLIRMTLDILKVTHIGKEVNGLRKWEGEVGDKAKALVKKWKQLLPDSDSPSAGNSSSTPVTNGQEKHTDHLQQHSSRSKKEGEGGEYSSLHRVHKSSSQVATDSLRASSSECDGFSRALMADPSAPLSSSSDKRTRETVESNDTSPTEKHKHKRKHKSSHKDPVKSSSSKHSSPSTQVSSLSASSSTSPQRHLGASSLSTLTRPKTPPHRSFLDIPSLPGGPTYSPKSEDSSGIVNSKKRKANFDSTLDSVALTKRSRTQVYSGKKNMTGPQAVPSLFDQSMRVLMDNIDDIEEVGGVPYFILEPVLQKCTPTQLMRLEEYNEHFIEETDPLWEKHCCKEFKGCKPRMPQSWRELYIERLAQREEKLKNLAATIKAKEMARQEPVRKAMMADVSRMPLRRGRSKVGTSSPSFRSRRHDDEQPSSTASRLKKQTMKMAKQLQQMKVYKPGRR